MKKYIFIGLITITIIAGVFIIYKTIYKDKTQIADVPVLEQNTIQPEDTTSNIAEETEAVQESNNTVVEETIDTPTIGANTPSTQNTTSKTNTTQATKTAPSSNQSVKAADTPSQVQQAQPVEQQQQQEPVQQVIPPTPSVPKEEFKPNAKMAQDMIDVINNNPSQFMIDYGYTVTVDSSIITLTNQFTFTTQRVINMIQYKCGTIRVYAQDYYKDGQYQWTECYII